MIDSVEQHDSNQMMARLSERARELANSSLDHAHAFNRAWLEYAISDQWPSGWGDDLEILIYGDFQPPTGTLSFERLGITVYPERLQNTVISSALCVLKARVRITDRSVDAVIDAIGRINLLLGAWTLTSWGNAACGWWCYITHGGLSGTMPKLQHEDLTTVSGSLLDLPDRVRGRVHAALYWVRSGQSFFKTAHDANILRRYAAHWNAFECLGHKLIKEIPLA